MFTLLPTCDTHAAVAEIAAALLDRYWPGHPPLHVLHYAVRPKISGATLHDCGRQQDSRWLATISRFLRSRTDDLFLLILDDYALCGPARTSLIDAGAELLKNDPAVGLFPLCWYPAPRRTARAGHPEIVTLEGAPILLQAAIWRREWFLELSDAIDPRASPWGFEALATQAAKRNPREICTADIPAPAHLDGRLIDGFDKTDWPLPYHNLMHRGHPEARHAAFLRREGFAFHSRGLGDTVAKLAERTGLSALARSVEHLTGRDCGCAKRRNELNKIIPYRS